ncbi:MAG TPA: hypothetical protein PK966_08005 [Syntrophorhabdaceae bacterium]|jgi:hypothetical protein|nr:MAG: hypothetical protein BWX92_02774 [Deltaproteobacteria bacterium ADurb.Bin135]HOD79338.1 hypothetical protein [Syntrophorhabdus sp.]HOS05995.1 hypothetical protein [Syntrophorhabdaceae bacterium]
MKDTFLQHRIIADILKEDTTISYAEWQSRVFRPIKPFYKDLDRLIMAKTTGLVKANPYKWNSQSKQTARQCLTKQKWNFSHENLPYRPDGVAAFVQLSDYESGALHVILWGMSWWGKKKDSLPILELFESTKGDGKLVESPSTIGYSGTFLRIFSNTMTIEEVLALKHDIKDEISDDIAGIVNRMNDYLSKP